MATSIQRLERLIETLRSQVRQALVAGDRSLAASLRRELRDAEAQWEEAVDRLAPDRPSGDSTPGQAAGDRQSHGATPPPAEPPGGLGALRPARTRPGATEKRQPEGESEGRAATAPAAGAEPSGTAGAVGRVAGGLVLPVREQVYQALTLLTVPSAPKLVSAVHEAFFAGVIFGARLTSLRRDEERSFRIAPFGRPYYLCAALTADLLAPARGLLAVSTWPMERRVIGPLSPRVDFLTAAIQVAGGVQRLPSPTPEALRLLWRFAVNIPGGMAGAGKVDAAWVARAAEAELEVHADADLATRRAAARRARSQLDDAQQLFGTRLRVTPTIATVP